MLSNTDVEELAKRMNVPLAYCGFKDELPTKLKTNKYYMINLEDAEDINGNDNGGSHWTGFQVGKNGNGKMRAVYFDSYGAPPPEVVKKTVKKNFPDIVLNHTTKNIQSMMNSACGWYQLAWAHFINSKHTTHNIENDTANFLDFFIDLDKETDFKRNEWILKHFFRAKDPALRKPVSVLPDPDTIVSSGSAPGGLSGGNVAPLQCDVKYV